MYVYGKNTLKEIVSAGYPLKHIFFSNSKAERGKLSELIDFVEKLGYSFSFTSNEALEKMVFTNKHQGVVIDIGEEFNYSSVDILDSKKELFVVILDQIHDPHNFGAIVRSSVAAGVDAIIIPKDNAVDVTPIVVKASAGQIFKIPIIKVTNISRTIEILKKKNVWVYGADSLGKPYYQIDYSGSVCIVFGNEGEGIRKNVKNHCDELISIPMLNNVESLNVSVSAGIILFEIKKNKNIV